MTATSSPGPLALVGSGEYLPQMADLEAGLLEGRPPRYVQLATAAVPDGPSVVEYWHDLGTAQAKRLGVVPVILAVNDRSDADDEVFAAQVDGTVAEALGLPGKPDPAVFVEAARRLGVAPRAVVVEDAEAGVEAGHEVVAGDFVMAFGFRPPALGQVTNPSLK